MCECMPTLSNLGGVVVFRNESDVVTLFSYSPHGGMFLTLTYRTMQPTWKWMRFFEIVDSVPICHVVVHGTPLPIRNLATVEDTWRRRLYELLQNPIP